MMLKKQPTESLRIFKSDMEKLKELQAEFQNEATQKMGIEVRFTMPETIGMVVRKYQASRTDRE